MSLFPLPGIVRSYDESIVDELRGSLSIEYTLAQRGALSLRQLLESRTLLPALGALTGNQAVQMVKAGLEAIYVSGWQVAADGNPSGQTYPDQGLYPVDAVARVVKRLNCALQRADQIDWAEGKREQNWFVPLIADAEAGFGGPLNVFELTKALIEAGAAGLHLEDQLTSERRCGHLGGKVLAPANQFVRTLTASRLASDVLSVPIVIIARTDAAGARLVASDVDAVDRSYMTGRRTEEGYYEVKGGVEYAIDRALVFAPYADMLWWETSTPSLDEARIFATEVHRRYPGKWLAYNCSPSFNWCSNWSTKRLEAFQEELAEVGYKFQFVTIAGFHSINMSMFDLARRYRTRGMAAYAELQAVELDAQRDGYTAVKHQREVGVGYFERVASAISGAKSSRALSESTEVEQFRDVTQMS